MWRRRGHELRRQRLSDVGCWHGNLREYEPRDRLAPVPSYFSDFSLGRTGDNSRPNARVGRGSLQGASNSGSIVLATGGAHQGDSGDIDIVTGESAEGNTGSIDATVGRSVSGDGGNIGLKAGLYPESYHKKNLEGTFTNHTSPCSIHVHL